MYFSFKVGYQFEEEEDCLCLDSHLQRRKYSFKYYYEIEAYYCKLFRKIIKGFLFLIEFYFCIYSTTKFAYI